ncbi:MAG: GNAT family N-acetyltransferase [Eubacteriales bacterium]|nr:GNAT family N-acetyltransferase [Eubacteriales bacterium]
MWKKYKDKWKNTDRQTRRRQLLTIGILAAILIAMVVLFATVGNELILFVSDPALFRAWVQGMGFVGKLAYIGIMIVQVVVAIIPGEPIELVAGYAFGAWQGLLLAQIGTLIGSASIFLAVKKWGMRAVEAFMPKEKLQSFRFLQDSTRRNAIVFLIFFIPGTPKDVLTYFVGLTPMKLGEWLLITSIARIPSVLSSTLTGAAIGDNQYLIAVAIYGVTAIVSLIGALIYKKMHAKQSLGEIAIREATPEEAQDIIALTGVWEQENITYGLRKDTPEDLDGCRLWVARREEKTVGFVAAREETSKRRSSILEENERYLEIEELYVLPEERKLGLGDMLFKQAEDYARSAGYRHVLLSTATKDTAAMMRFYVKKQGMTVWSMRMFKEL